MWNRLTVIGACLVLAACSGAADVRSVVQERALTPSVFRAATEQKQTRTLISGTAFSTVSLSARDKAVLAAMQPARWRHHTLFTPRTVFTAAPSGHTNQDYHVVVEFNPLPADSLAEFCQLTSPRATQSSNTGPLVARMVLCRDTQPLSSSRGQVAHADSPADPRFQDMITRMTMALYPERRDRNNCVNTLKTGRC